MGHRSRVRTPSFLRVKVYQQRRWMGSSLCVRIHCFDCHLRRIVFEHFRFADLVFRTTRGVSPMQSITLRPDICRKIKSSCLKRVHS